MGSRQSGEEKAVLLGSEEALTGHRWWRYRGCAPLPAGEAEFPGQAAGDPGLHVDAWHGADRDEGVPEPQKERIAREKAAVAVCERCPVLEACRAYACGEDAEGRLREPQGVWGGLLAIDRHRLLIRRRMVEGPRVPARDRLAEVRTPQKQALLAALAREVDEELVAWRAGLDLRTSNWQRSLLCGLLGLDKETATRGELLGAARRLGVMPRGVRVRPDGRWPVAAAPTTDGVRQRRIAPGAPVQLALPVLSLLPVPVPPLPGPARSGTGVSGRGRVGPPSRPAGRGGAGPGRRTRRGRLRLVRPAPPGPDPVLPEPLSLFSLAPAPAGAPSSLEAA